MAAASPSTSTRSTTTTTTTAKRLGDTPADPAVETAVVPYADTFTLHSRPGALRTIYLDFDGYSLTGTSRSRLQQRHRVAGSSYNSDSNPATFSNAAQRGHPERLAAHDQAARRSTSTSPPQEPGFNAIDRSSSSDRYAGTRAVFTTDSVLGGTCSCGGIAYVGVFDSTTAADYSRRSSSPGAWAPEQTCPRPPPTRVSNLGL